MKGNSTGEAALSQSACHNLGPSQAVELQAAQGATTKRTGLYVEEERRSPAPQIRRALRRAQPRPR